MEIVHSETRGLVYIYIYISCEMVFFLHIDAVAIKYLPDGQRSNTYHNIVVVRGGSENSSTALIRATDNCGPPLGTMLHDPCVLLSIVAMNNLQERLLRRIN